MGLNWVSDSSVVSSRDRLSVPRGRTETRPILRGACLLSEGKTRTAFLNFKKKKKAGVRCQQKLAKSL